MVKRVCELVEGVRPPLSRALEKKFEMLFPPVIRAQ